MDVDVTENSCDYEMDLQSKIMATKRDIKPENWVTLRTGEAEMKFKC